MPTGSDPVGAVGADLLPALAKALAKSPVGAAAAAGAGASGLTSSA